eukprot:TRINITY_DN28895_c0_g1_i2.p1 TRINITY_DN28895_c0_g1~~TRINITY_DN28895_c0_g1_i2.p1  ORF type:complete len:269 (+),score=71.72 TRINITY_DN28895_c0_g1_i2:80-808(+)
MAAPCRRCVALAGLLAAVGAAQGEKPAAGRERSPCAALMGKWDIASVKASPSVVGVPGRDSEDIAVVDFDSVLVLAQSAADGASGVLTGTLRGPAAPEGSVAARITSDSGECSLLLGDGEPYLSAPLRFKSTGRRGQWFANAAYSGSGGKGQAQLAMTSADGFTLSFTSAAGEHEVWIGRRPPSLKDQYHHWIYEHWHLILMVSFLALRFVVSWRSPAAAEGAEASSPTDQPPQKAKPPAAG